MADVDYLRYAQLLGQRNPTGEGLAMLGDTLDSNRRLAMQKQQVDLQSQGLQRQNRLADMQITQQQATLADTEAQRQGMQDVYGATTPREGYANQFRMAQKEKEKKQQQDNSKFVIDTFSKVSEAVKNGTIDEDTADKYFHGALKLNGTDLGAQGITLNFKKQGGYYSGPVTEDSLFLVNGKPVKYGNTGIVEKARIVGLDPQTNIPIYQMDKETTFKENKTDSKGFDTIDKGLSTLVIPRDGSPRYEVKKTASPNTIIRVNSGIDKPGKAPAGYRYTSNGDLEAIPGGPADQKQETKRQAQAQGQAAFDETIAVIDKLLAHPGREAGTGLSSTLDVRNYLPGTNAKDFRRELESFDGKLFLANVAKMKGMGALSDAEGKKLTAAAGAIKPDMSDKAFVDNMNIIKAGLEAAKSRLDTGTLSSPQATSRPLSNQTVRPPLSAIFGK